jgi:hypothetical protein
MTRTEAGKAAIVAASSCSAGQRSIAAAPCAKLTRSAPLRGKSSGFRRASWVAGNTRLNVWRHPAGYRQCRLCHWLHTRSRLFGGGFARGAGEPEGAVICDRGWEYFDAPRAPQSGQRRHPNLG